MSRKGRELCPNGAKREGKPRFSGVCRAHAVVSPLNLSSESRTIFSRKKWYETGMYGEVVRSTGGDKKAGFRYSKSKRRYKFAKRASLVIFFCRYEMRSSFGRDSSDGYCVAFAQSLGHSCTFMYTPVGLYAGSLSRPRLTPETSAVPAYSKFGDRNFAPTGQRGRRDLAEQRSARTRLSLRGIFPQNTRCIFSAKKWFETKM